MFTKLPERTTFNAIDLICYLATKRMRKESYPYHGFEMVFIQCFSISLQYYYIVVSRGIHNYGQSLAFND